MAWGTLTLIFKFVPSDCTTRVTHPQRVITLELLVNVTGYHRYP